MEQNEFICDARIKQECNSEDEGGPWDVIEINRYEDIKQEGNYYIYSPLMTDT